MYEILAMGRHPLYKKNDSKEDFLAKLMNPTWLFNEAHDDLSKDFFLKMTQVVPAKRYSAN
jgi:hypothetical protein